MFSMEDRRRAVDLYFTEGMTIRKVIAELGYPSEGALVKWVREDPRYTGACRRSYTLECKTNAARRALEGEPLARVARDAGCTPADFRSLAPIVLEQALKESGTQLLEPYLSFTLYAPREYLSRAYHDAPKYCATIETVQVKKDEVVFTGEIPARCIQAYRTDLAFYTNGQSVCLTELKGYQAAVGKPVIQPRRPNSRLDKVRYMFQKIM